MYTEEYPDSDAGGDGVPRASSEMQHKRTTNISHFIHFLSFFFEKTKH
jgi:hypothetical protein